MSPELDALLREQDARRERVLRRLYAIGRERYIPIMDDEGAVAMARELQRRRPRLILEIGTAIGYSTLLALSVCENARVVSVDIDEDRLEIAREALAEAGVADRVQLIADDAAYAISLMNGRFDWILLDGPKGQYGVMWPTIAALLNNNGAVWVDDVDYLGLVKGDGYPAHKHRTIVTNLRAWLRDMESDPSWSVQRREGKAGALLIQRNDGIVGTGR